MKKIILLLLSFISLSVSAQLQKSVLFDFSKPTELSPSITPSTISGGIVQVSSTTFKNKQVSINFTQGSQPTGAQIFTYIDPYNKSISYSLRITGTTSMKVALSDGAVLDSIRFSELSTIGDLHLAYDQPGYQDPYQEYKFWKSNSKDYSEVSFYNNSQASQIRQMYVYYTTPSELLEPVSCSINPDEVLSSLNQFTLTFQSDMTVKDASGIQLISSAGNERTVSAKADGKKIVLTLNEAITTDDVVTIKIPAKCFQDIEGFENKELTYTFKIVEPRNSLKYISITPQPGIVKNLDQMIKVSFDESVKLASTDAIVLYKDSKALYPLSVSVDGKVVVLSHENGIVQEEGVYSLTIPEGRIHNAFYQAQGQEDLDRYNAEIKIEYTIKADEPQPQVDSETMKAAKEILKNSGVGYPAENSTARKNLEKLTTAEKVPSDSELSKAIDAFYAETSIMLPASNKYYKVIAVNSNGNQLYLSYKNGSVVLSQNANEAAALKATQNSDKTVVLQANDGKYLHVLVGASNYQGTSEKNVTEQCTADINHLHIARLNLKDKAKETFGLVSLYGSLGVDEVLGTSANAFALINHEAGKIVTDSKYTDLYFDTRLSSAFKFEETDEHAGTTPIEVAGTLTPETVKSNAEELTLSLTGADSYTLANPAMVYFANESGERVEAENHETILSAVDGSTNQYSVHLTGLADGSYQLVIPEGVFNCANGENTGVSREIRIPFEINSEETDDFDYSFLSYSYLQYVGLETPVTDTSLNDVVLYIQMGWYTGMIPDPSKIIKLAYYDDSKLMKTGHFESYPDIIKKVPDTYGIKLVYDEPIRSGEFTRRGRYAFLIPAATYGDANFGKWLKDHNSIKKSECKVNPEIMFTVLVDNKAATGIESIYTENGDHVIYDLTGRRLKKVMKSGLYIVNGKKVFIKR